MDPFCLGKWGTFLASLLAWVCLALFFTDSVL